LKTWTYTQGLHDLGNSVYAYLQPNGSWGWSNSGIIVDGKTSLLVDTLYDLQLTGEMLATMRRSIPAATQIETLVNTHSNGDHCNGNQLVGASRRITSLRTKEEMEREPSPAIMAQIAKNAPADSFQRKVLGNFAFSPEIVVPAPTETFEARLELQVGTKQIMLFEVGPAHTSGDTLVYVPGDKVVFTGDILFSNGHPVMWAGPVSNWIRACETILSLDVETIVPGHGPITDKQAVARLKGYWEYLLREVPPRHAAGLDALEAALDIPLEAYADWQDVERIVVNVVSIYRELGVPAPNVHELFPMMARYRQRKFGEGM
jgi:glyoxylase-like metal-dependent hydrolase (beta-lactamase superfamily II)